MSWLRGSPSVGRPKQNPDVDRLLAARTAAPSTLERIARVSRGVVAGICWLLLVGAGAAAAEKMSLPRILLVETQSLTKVQIPVTVGRSRLVGIRTIETEVAVHIQPAAPSKGEWIGVRENLVHRSSRPRDLSLLRLLVVSAAVAVAVGWASRRRRH